MYVPRKDIKSSNVTENNSKLQTYIKRYNKLTKIDRKRSKLTEEKKIKKNRKKTERDRELRMRV